MKFFRSRLFLAIGFIVILFLASPQSISGLEQGVNAEINTVIQEELAGLNLDQITSFLSRLDTETKELLPVWDPLAWVRGRMDLDFPGILKNVTRFLGREIVINLTLLGKLIILAVIGGVLVHFQQAWSGESLGNLVYNIIYLILMGLAVQSFTTTLNLANQTLERVNGFILALLPTIFTLLAALL